LDPTSPEAQTELARRHKAAATTVLGLLVATVLLSVLAFLAKPYFTEKPNVVLDMAVRIVILVLGLGAVVWRRTKFQTMRLQDITGLTGVTGLLKTHHSARSTRSCDSHYRVYRDVNDRERALYLLGRSHSGDRLCLLLSHKTVLAQDVVPIH
jgi:FtsH-binding integral membrane protein